VGWVRHLSSPITHSTAEPLVVGGAVSLPLAAIAQKRPARLGFLDSGDAEGTAIFVEALKEGLRENGLQEGRDYVFDFGWVEGNYNKFPTLAEAMVKNDDAKVLHNSDFSS
jgi:hypothetical protein